MLPLDPDGLRFEELDFLDRGILPSLKLKPGSKVFYFLIGAAFFEFFELFLINQSFSAI